MSVEVGRSGNEWQKKVGYVMSFAYKDVITSV